MDLRTVAALLALTAACGGREAAAPVPPRARHGARVLAGRLAPPAVAAPISHNPFHGDRQSAAEGERTFAAMNCDGCHGGGAVGAVGPNLRDGRWRYGGSDAEIFESIFYGQPHGMPAYGGLLPPAAVWKLVTYLQSLEAPADVPTEAWK